MVSSLNTSSSNLLFSNSALDGLAAREAQSATNLDGLEWDDFEESMVAKVKGLQNVVIGFGFWFWFWYFGLELEDV